MKTNELADVLASEFDYDAVATQSNREETEALEYERLADKYNATDTHKFLINEVPRLIRAEAEMTMCNGCSGLPCRKTIGVHFQPVINNEDGYITVRYKTCNYYRNRIASNAKARASIESRIPAQYQQLRLRDYTIDTNNIVAVQRAQNFIANPTIGIYYYGSCGCGKSMLAAIIVNELLGKLRTIYMDVPSMLDTLRESLKEAAAIDKLMAELSTVPLLIMDDIGAERTTEWTTERLYLLINNRVNNRLPTIYTCNFTLTELYHHYGDNIIAQRLTSRIHATCTRIELKGGDRRVKPKC